MLKLQKFQKKKGKEIVVLVGTEKVKGEINDTLFLFSADGKILKKRSIGGIGKGVTVEDINFDQLPEIVVIKNSGEIMVFDTMFNLIFTKHFSEGIDEIIYSGDINADESPEIICRTSTRAIVIFNNNFIPICKFDKPLSHLMIINNKKQKRLIGKYRRFLWKDR